MTQQHCFVRFLGSQVLAPVLIACLAVVLPAQAALRLEFAGDVASGPLPGSGGDVHVGDPFVGSFTFDPTATDQLPADPTRSRFASSSAHMELTAGALVLNTAAVDADVWEVRNQVADFDWLLITAYAPDDVTIEVKLLIDDSHSFLTSDAWPAAGELPPASSFDERFVTVFRDRAKTDFWFDGWIQSVALVPEPATLVLAVAGGLAVVRRKHRR